MEVSFVFEFDENTVKLTKDQAKELYDHLHSFFGEKKIDFGPVIRGVESTRIVPCDVNGNGKTSYPPNVWYSTINATGDIL